MAITLPPHRTAVRAAAAPAAADAIPQYSLRKILGVWASAMIPMGLLAWVVAPWLAGQLDGPNPFTRSLIVCLTAGLVWQFVLVMIMLAPERRSPDWPGYRKALWLNGPPRKRQWLLVPVLAVALAIEEFVPQIHHAATRELSSFFDSHAGHVFMSGSWGWLAVLTTMFVFNTVLGEELLFRGLLLPRMNGVFGRKDWLANGALFALYHVHVPWVIPATFVDAFVVAYPAKRFRSALFSIAVHSIQSVFFFVFALSLVLG
jgi:membrane protease YdiL (CAAX protease family)